MGQVSCHPKASVLDELETQEDQLRTLEATKCNFLERVTFCGFKDLGTADKDHELLSNAPEPDGLWRDCFLVSQSVDLHQ